MEPAILAAQELKSIGRAVQREGDMVDVASQDGGKLAGLWVKLGVLM